jgi:hypothetical protein
MQGSDSGSLRTAIKRTMPQMVHAVRFSRLLWNQVRFPVAGTILDWQGKVQGGPFAGMRHPRSGTGHYAELIGTYELSLIPVIEQVIARKPQLIINVGAGSGYYAMGFAWRCRTTKVIAYEADPTRRGLMQKYLHVNELHHRIDLRGLCTTEALQASLAGNPGAFLLMDAEGAEESLLKPDISRIDQTEILVELHEMYVPGITRRLQESFAETHRVILIEESDVEDHRPPPGLKKTLGPFATWSWRRLTNEHREGQTVWMHLIPKLHPSLPQESRFQAHVHSAFEMAGK